jgi:hypothetical protein
MRTPVLPGWAGRWLLPVLTCQVLCTFFQSVFLFIHHSLFLGGYKEAMIIHKIQQHEIREKNKEVDFKSSVANKIKIRNLCHSQIITLKYTSCSR